MVESIKVIAGNIVAGQGFTIYGFNTSETGDTRIYGNFNVAWVWD